MLRIASKSIGVVLALSVGSAQALTIFTCEPEWAALSKQLAPGAKVFSATHVYQDPHYIEARPSLIAKLARADIAICSGAGLESGWLPALQKRASNRKVMDGAAGMLYLSSYISTIEKHDSAFFTTEHVHPEGNPHFHLDPERVYKLASVISHRIQKIDPDSASDYSAALSKWSKNWKEKMWQWKQQMAPLSERTVVVQHTSFSYLMNWGAIEAAADLEPKPGVPPTMTHAQSLVEEVDKHKPVAIVTNWYQNDRAAQWLAAKTGVKHLNLPATVDTKGEINTMERLFDHLIGQLLEANNAGS